MDSTILYSLPLIITTCFSVFLPVFDSIVKQKKGLMFWTTVIGLIIILGINLYLLLIPDFYQGISVQNKLGYFGRIISNSLVLGSYTVVFDILFSIGSLLALFASRQYLIKGNYEHKEYYSLLMFSLVGMMYIAHSNNMLILFLGIELMSISFFVLSGFFRNRLTSVEAALKYFLLGAFASSFLVFGMAMVYGATGSLELNLISSKVLSGNFQSVYFSIGLGLLFVGLAFKASTFPFHQWAPDVYTGAPTVVTAFMSTAGKTASFVAFIIIAKSLIPIIGANSVSSVMTLSISKYSREIIAIISAMTMLVGNISALVQKNVKRMLAYSSVAHAGYILIGIASNNINGWSGIVFYSASYIFMQIGAFVVVSLIEKENETLLNLEDYNGLSKTNPYLAATMAIFMFSLVGLPPFAGFFGKYYLFLSAIESGFVWLTIIAVIASLISIYFYIGLVINMFFKESKTETYKVNLGLSNVSLIISLIGIFFLGLFPNFLIDIALKLF